MNLPHNSRQHTKRAPTWLLHGYCQKFDMPCRRKSKISQGDSTSRTTAALFRKFWQSRDFFWENRSSLLEKEKIYHTLRA
jgi:hypothetical protein